RHSPASSGGLSLAYSLNFPSPTGISCFLFLLSSFAGRWVGLPGVNHPVPLPTRSRSSCCQPPAVVRPLPAILFLRSTPPSPQPMRPRQSSRQCHERPLAGPERKYRNLRPRHRFQTAAPT